MNRRSLFQIILLKLERVAWRVLSVAKELFQGILINGQFLGPDIYSVTNDNLIINVYNSLPKPFLLSWNGIQQRRSSWQDGVYGTNCPIPPGKNFTYVLQVKDQIGSFFYFPSLAFHKSAGAFGGIKILSRPRIPVRFLDPASRRLYCSDRRLVHHKSHYVDMNKEWMTAPRLSNEYLDIEPPCG